MKAEVYPVTPPDVSSESPAPVEYDTVDSADNPVASLARFAASSGASLKDDLFVSAGGQQTKNISQPKCLLPELVRKGDGVGPVVALNEYCGKLLVATVGIADVVERTGLTVSIWGSKDQIEWGAKPLVTFRQRQYCGVYSMLMNMATYPDIGYLRVQWSMSRWGRGERTPFFGFEVFLEESGARVSSFAVA